MTSCTTSTQAQEQILERLFSRFFNCDIQARVVKSQGNSLLPAAAGARIVFAGQAPLVVFPWHPELTHTRKGIFREKKYWDWLWELMMALRAEAGSEGEATCEVWPWIEGNKSEKEHAERNSPCLQQCILRSSEDGFFERGLHICFWQEGEQEKKREEEAESAAQWISLTNIPSEEGTSSETMPQHIPALRDEKCFPISFVLGASSLSLDALFALRPGDELKLLTPESAWKGEIRIAGEAFLPIELTRQGEHLSAKILRCEGEKIKKSSPEQETLHAPGR